MLVQDSSFLLQLSFYAVAFLSLAAFAVLMLRNMRPELPPGLSRRKGVVSVAKVQREHVEVRSPVKEDRKPFIPVVRSPIKVDPKPFIPDPLPPAGESPLEEALPAGVEIKSSPVEFFVLAPKAVRPGVRFAIHVHVTNLPEAHLGLEQTDESFETLIAQVENGSRVGLVLQSLPPLDRPADVNLRVQIDAPYQALTWTGRNLVATFNVRAPHTDTKLILLSRVWITIRGIDIGTIDVEVPLDPEAQRAAPTTQHRQSPGSAGIQPDDLSTQWKLSELAAQGRRATAFKTAFICYAHDDKPLVDVFHKVVEAALSKCYIDRLDMLQETHWLVQAAEWIDAVDVIYIMWSSGAAGRPSIEEELEVICAQKRLRANRAKRPAGAQGGQPTRLTICVALLGGDERKLPDCISVDCGFTRRPQALKNQQLRSSS